MRFFLKAVRLFKQSGEASLLEVPVGSEGFRDVLVFHDHKGDAVGQRPIFVWTAGHSFEASV